MFYFLICQQEANIQDGFILIRHLKEKNVNEQKQLKGVGQPAEKIKEKEGNNAKEKI